MTKVLSVLSRQSLLNGYKEGTLGFCEHFVFGKWTRVKFNKKVVHKIIGKLDYVYSDLRGPYRVSSKSGVKYFMTLIDDYFRNV